MHKRAVIYARVSQDVQRDNYSIPSQVAACRQHAEEVGYSIVGSLHVDRETGRDCVAGPASVPAFVDDFTGTELLRPNISTMLKFLRDEGADAVIVLSLDRLARDPYIRQTLEREIEALGARVIYVQGNYAETPEGEIHKDLDGAFAKWENLKRTERSVRGKVAKAQRGLFVVGAAPYGYKIDKKAAGGLIVDEETAPIVQRIFAMYVEEGRTLRSIARQLNAEGIPSPRGRQWSNATVHSMLRNETYAGRAFYNKSTTIITGDGVVAPKKRRTVDREPGEAIAIPVAPIIDGVTFERVRRVLDFNRAATRKQANRFYLLSGIVFCAACGRRYTVQTELPRRNTTAEVRHYRHRTTDGHCRDHMKSANILETRVWDGIMRVLLAPDQLAAGYEAALADLQEKQARARTHLETLRRILEKLDNRQAGLVRIYADGDVTRREYLEQRAELERERGQLQEEIKKIETNLAGAMSATELIEVRALGEEIRAAVEGGNLTEEEKRELLLNLRVRVTINENETAKVEGIFDPFTVSLLSKTC